MNDVKHNMNMLLYQSLKYINSVSGMNDVNYIMLQDQSLNIIVILVT